MTYATQMIRPGMTAIAAVLALTATPLLAQSAEPAPVVIAPPSPVAAAPAPTPAPVVQTSTPAPTVATPSTTTTTTTTAAEPAPRATRTSTPVRRTATRTTTTTRTVAPRAAAPAPTPVTVPEAAPVAATPLPVEAAPAPAVPAEPVAATKPAPAATASPYEDALPVAGGLALLALAGGALALRRKRVDSDEPLLETYENDRVIPAEPAYAAPIATRRAPVADPVPARSHASAPTAAAAGAATGRLPANPSLYGRHVQAAYAGPTPENPSASLSKRLKRARFFDQRARQAAAGLATPMVPEPVLATAAATPRQAMPQMGGKAGWSFGTMRPAFSS